MQDNIHINSNKNSAKTPSANSANSSSVISLGELSPESTPLSTFLATHPLIRTFIPLFIALGLLSLAFLILTMSRTHAETTTASVTVPVSCTMTASPSSEHTTTMNNGTYNEVAAETTLSAACNDNGGYSIYAVGYSDNASGNTNSTSMIGPSISGTSLTIPTCTLANCTSTTPDVSRWAMKLTPISGTSTPTILGDYNNYSPIPLEPTKVITYPAITATDNRSETKATYAVAISSTQPSGTYTGKVKYTIVHPNYANADGAVPTMQDATPSSLAKLMPNTGNSTTLVDSRDGKSYTAAKLADGKYWMTTNLDLAGGTALSANDTDVTVDYINGFTSSNGLTKSGNTIVLPSSSNSFSTSDSDLAVVYNSGHATCSSNSATGSCYSYYSFPAATLGAKDSSGSTMVTGDGYNTVASICPKGWKLPTATTEGVSRDNGGYTGGDSYKMILAVTGQSSLANGYYEDTANFYNAAGPNTTPNFLLSGVYNGTSFDYGGSRGYYWSSTSYSGTSAYYLRFDSGSVSSAYGSNRKSGFAVRCVFDQPTMQSVTSSKLADLMPNTGDSTILVDSRDGKSYSVAKLPDGKYWMTTNLDLAGGTTLTSADSNVTSDYTLPASSEESIDGSAAAAVYNSNSTTCGNSSPCYSYYTYAAATAGTDPSSGNATSDICPKGWRLPTKDEYSTLESTYTTSETLTASPFYAVYSGFYHYGTFGGGTTGVYWSSTVYNENGFGFWAYYLYFDTSGTVDAGSQNTKAIGVAVRCVAR